MLKVNRKITMIAAILILFVLGLGYVFGNYDQHITTLTVESIKFQNGTTNTTPPIIDKIVDDLNNGEYHISGHDFKVSASINGNSLYVYIIDNEFLSDDYYYGVLINIYAENDGIVSITFDENYFFNGSLGYCRNSTYDYYVYMKTTIDIFEEIVAIVGDNYGYDLDEIFDNSNYSLENINSTIEEKYGISHTITNDCYYVISDEGSDESSSSTHNYEKLFWFEMYINTSDEDNNKDEEDNKEDVVIDNDDTLAKDEVTEEIENPSTGCFINLGILGIMLIISLIGIIKYKKKNNVYKL